MADGWGGEMVLTTERLALRPFDLDDLPLYEAVCADPLVMRYLGGVWAPDRTREVMLAANASVVEDGYGMVAVERRADGRFLGAAGLSIEHWYPDDLQVGWRLAPEWWGHGYATEAAVAWLRHGFGVLGRERIMAMADVPNERSVAVMRRLGMMWDHEAELTDGDDRFEAVIYAITAPEWRRRHDNQDAGSPAD